MSPSLSPIVRLSNRVVRDTARQWGRLARRIANEAVGVYHEARHWRAPKVEMDDNTLARKVETELFRPAGAPKGSVDINVVEGVVYLRGQVKRPGQINDLERRARKIPEVRGVENLLHLPKTPSPTRADSPKRAQKNPPSPKPAPRRRTSATRVRTTAEDPSAAAASKPSRSSRASAAKPAGTRAGTRGSRAAAKPGAGTTSRTRRTTSRTSGTTSPASVTTSSPTEATPPPETTPPATTARGSGAVGGTTRADPTGASGEPQATGTAGASSAPEAGLSPPPAPLGGPGPASVPPETEPAGEAQADASHGPESVDPDTRADTGATPGPPPLEES